MSGWGGNALRWGAAGAVVLVAHVAGGVWATQVAQRNAVMALPEPVFAELLPEPLPPEAASPSAETEPAPEAEPQAEPEQTKAEPPPEPPLEPPPAEEVAEQLPEEEPVPDFEVPALTPLPPVTDFSELLPDSALLLATSDRPKTRPVRREPEPEPEPEPQQTRRERRSEPPKEQAKQEPRRERAQPAQQTKRASPAEGTAREQRGRAQQGKAQANPGASKQQMNSWTSRVGSRVASHMKRTRVPGGGRGTVTIQVSVSISANGAASARLVSSTGNPQVDAALARQAGRMPRMPAPPNGQGASFVLPIQIKL